MRDMREPLLFLFMYIPEFMDDDTTDDEFEEIPEYRKGYPCDGSGRTTDKDTFCLFVNKCPKFEVELYLSKYAASNYEVGTGRCNIFEYANELLAKFIEPTLILMVIIYPNLKQTYRFG